MKTIFEKLTAFAVVFVCFSCIGLVVPGYAEGGDAAKEDAAQQQEEGKSAPAEAGEAEEAEESENLLKNSGFESTEEVPEWNPYGVAPGWRMIWRKPAEVRELGISMGVDADTAHTGAQSLKLETLKQATHVSVCQRDLAVRAGDTCRLTFWTKSYREDAQELPIRVGLYCSGDLPGGRQYMLEVESFHAGRDWKQITTALQVPEGTKDAQLVLELRDPDGQGTTGTVWFDDVSLTRPGAGQEDWRAAPEEASTEAPKEAPPPAASEAPELPEDQPDQPAEEGLPAQGENVLVNPGFERTASEPGSYVVTESWRLFFTNPKEVEENEAAIAIDTENARSGKQCLKIESLKTAMKITVAQEVSVPLTGGDTGKLSVWCKGSNETGGEVPIRLSLYYVGNSDDGKQFKNRVQSFKATGEWKQVEMPFTVPQGANKVLVFLEFRDQGEDALGTVWFDDASLVKNKTDEASLPLTHIGKTESPAGIQKRSRRSGSAGSEPPNVSTVLQSIRKDHPRLFLNREILEKAKQEGMTSAQKKWLGALTQQVNRYPSPPGSTYRLTLQGGRGNDGKWGLYCAHTALVYLLTGEKEYYNKAMALLRYTAGMYSIIHQNKKIPYGRSHMRLGVLSAYDWLYNTMPEDERKSIGKTLFPPLKAFYEHWRNTGYMRNVPINLYTDTVMGWYLGLVFLEAGVEGADEQVCTQLLRDSYEHHLFLFDMLSSGPDGIYPYSAMAYTTQNIQAEVNFIDSWRAAIGGDFARYHPKRMNMAEYFLSHTITPTRGRGKNYGYGDVYHLHNDMDGYHKHYMARVLDLYGGVLNKAGLGILRTIAQLKAPSDYTWCMRTDWDLCYQTIAAPLLMSNRAQETADLKAGLARLPRARHYPDPIGRTFMNSGWGEHDTYALFVAGMKQSRRKHYDENHFTIYKKGFLALDSGARGYSINRRQAGSNRNKVIGADHEINYYYDTIAHNCVLIHMDGEQLPGYWGQKAAENTGGMNKNYGAQVKAFETNECYTYIASDATNCYHEGKSQEVIRQFLFVYPDYFVVFDRVASKKPEQKKTWLLHTQHEPKVQGDTFSADHRQGRIFVRTLLPAEPHAQKIGGPGKEFWTGSRNWPVRPEWQSRSPDKHLFGCWRMEISSPQNNQRELFLHLLQVGDKKTLGSMAASKRIDGNGKVGVEFQAGPISVRVLFNKKGTIGGDIHVAKKGKVLVDRPLIQKVIHQQKLSDYR